MQEKTSLCKSSRGTGRWKAILLKIHRRILTITSGPERTGPHQNSEGREANPIHPHQKKKKKQLKCKYGYNQETICSPSTQKVRRGLTFQLGKTL